MRLTRPATAVVLGAVGAALLGAGANGQIALIEDGIVARTALGYKRALDKGR